MRVLILLVALICGLPSFASARCDVTTPNEIVVLGEVRLAYQSVGSARDPALLMIMGLGGQLIHWPDEVLERLTVDAAHRERFVRRLRRVVEGAQVEVLILQRVHELVHQIGGVLFLVE